MEHHITFKLMHNGQPVSCTDTGANRALHIHGEYWHIEQLMLFVHDLALMKGNDSLSAEMTVNSWQAEGVALLSLTPEACDQPTAENKGRANAELIFKAPIDLRDAEALRFKIGVPNALNHQNPLSQPSPLNLPLMFWSWQMGHKFVRWDMLGDKDKWSFHLGSLGCESVSVVRSPAEPCAEPNVISVELDSPTNQATEVLIHLDRLVSGITVSAENNCTLHSALESRCGQLIDNLTRNQVFEWH